ncbi:MULTISPECIES: NAD-dependent succinate-semialdehyde dehydrogenase [Chryseobacterium]|uniref:Succinate-semialdehyde dehydrogenase/glutarate-semialdehyde dehydrogenase n=1 Tax=Chryseobacterium camelliae TaxID=1265445 RepID=A0ABU0TL17_9FLAO|nr:MULTISPECIES: NAD-dependent succinate-semialdehyde dehydrogenase [Chryseobacterium]MDQ1097735.1 succinate-semialdehyde dehydrogenase/glutarate-semialdehyde dehydrogenase [Chryseobacterium camelliae]MDR6085107.1 succinate-semialdehyde dehydrogenase/glutarate-semialdehyde dehydrogenase [Chryseobacterium sp. SORGH_AS_0909]MDR6129463.1 succinate-semialdehyde dehydrogenase/glutarate-semialdehyde dehydrogenase [Chryseobacterium sp. SORGH_AS_1175]MDT3408409.1 succinate-semialdehyde dehydrogenase/gl
MDQLIENKILKADLAFNEWKKVPFEERQQLIAKAAALLSADSEKFGKIITTEMNKPIAQSVAEVEKCALMMNYYAEAENILKPEKVDSEFHYSEIQYVPKGVILGVMPWNFPFWQVLRFAVPAILAGNTVVLKHASICFGSGNAIEQVFLEAGFPEGIFQNLEVGHGEVKEILEHKAIMGVSLTGSEKAGAEVASIAGQNIKKSLLELGGSDAFIVLSDADLDEAAKVGALARLQNCGQTCVAAKRFIIDEKIEEEFLPKFIEEYKKFVPGDPMDKETKISGMARADLADDLEKQFNKALENGAEIILPLERVSENAFTPGLIRVNPGNPILQEELFGPLGMILTAQNDEEAVRIANDIPFGLSNSVWTKDQERQKLFIENLESGTVNINRMTSSDPRFPFGGTKSSGYGTELSLLALREFVTPRTVVGN